MATTQNDGKKLHFGITYVNSDHLPSIMKEKMLKKNPRRLYAVLSVDDCPDIRYEIPSLDLKVGVSRQMTFLAKPSATLNVQLFAKRSSHDDLFVAHAHAHLDSTGADAKLKVSLKPSVESGVTEESILRFKITASDRFKDELDIESMRKSLELNSKLVQAFGYISLLVKVGLAIAELNEIAKAVMGLIELANSQCEAFIARNESVLRLLEEIGQASILVADWDDPDLDEDRPNQRRIYNDLLPLIYQSLHLLWTLSENNPVKRLSQNWVDIIKARERGLAVLVERMQSNQHLDTQAAVFKLLVRVTDLHDDNCINQLRSARDPAPGPSKTCLPDTRVALLSRIRDWALCPTGPRGLLLHGAAGKGKSTIVNTIARELDGLAVVPFFAFSRRVPDRSSSQLIPTWAKQLARENPGFLRYLHSLRPRQLESSDIWEQLDVFLIRGLASGIDDGKPLIFTVDALDECAEEEADQLFHLLHDLISNSNLPTFVRFLFTYRPREAIIRTFSRISCLNFISIDDERDTVKDIHKFVHAQLHHASGLENMVDEVATAAQTLFQCAALLCAELRDPPSLAAQRKLIQRLKDGPVMSLYESYKTIMNIHFDKTDAEQMKLFRRVIAWVLLRGDVEDVLLRLGSLLIGTTSEEDPISLLHTSLRDFLLEPTESGALESVWPPAETMVIPAMSVVYSVAFSSDSTCIASGSADNTIQVWDVATGQQVYGKHIASGSDDKTIRVWDAATGQQVGSPWAGHRAWVRSVMFSPDSTHIASGSNDNTVRVWNVEKRGQVDKLFTGHKDVVRSVAFSPEGTRIVSGSQDKTIRVWDVATGQQVGKPLAGHEDWVSSVVFSPNGTCIASGSDDKTIRVWDAATGQQVGKPLAGHTYPIRSVSFSPDGKHIASGSDDKTIRVWDASTRQQVGALAGHAGYIRSVAFSLDGKHIASGSDDKTVRVWYRAMSQQVGALAGHIEWLSSVMVSINGKHIASGSDNKTVKVWDGAMGQQVGALASHTDLTRFRSVSFSPDSKHIASGSADNTIRVWDAATGQQVGDPLAGHKDYVNSVAFSSDGKHIASGSDDNTVRVWDAATGQQVGSPLVGHCSYVYSVAFSPDGTQIASGSIDGTIRVWNLAAGRQVGQPFTGHKGAICPVILSPVDTQITSGSDDKSMWPPSEAMVIPVRSSVYSVAFSPDGTCIASGSGNKTLQVWHGVTGKQVHALEGHTECIFSVTFSPDGTRIASGSLDKTIRVWDTATGQQIGKPLAGHTYWVSSVVFSPDGKRIASGSNDKTVRVWDAVTGQLIGEPLAAHNKSVRSVAFSLDGKHIASCSDDQTILVWDAKGHQVGALAGHGGLIRSVVFSPDGTQITSGSDGNTIQKDKSNGMVHFQNGWLKLEKDSVSTSHILWVPHAFRDCNFSLAPTLMIIPLPQPHISLQFNNAACGPDWAMMTKM
ncbi:WD40-repeat-containing domain protein [Mycena olivaceomarginata]|nr:WD40-repeat-containing domain protein [Mycena olivaceomarginata]